MEKPASLSRRMDNQDALKVLQDLLAKAETSIKIKLGRNDQRSIRKLIDLFSVRPAVELPRALKVLWPNRSRKSASSTFRSFKERINQRFNEMNRRIRLEHHKDNRPISDKTVWIERVLSDEEVRELELSKEASELAKRFEQEQRLEYHDTPLEEYVEQQVSVELPIVTFPEALVDFAEQVAPEHWEGLSEDEQAMLANLGTKLEPIVQLLPSIPGKEPPVVGFECLALGPGGESFDQIVKAMPRVDGGLLRALMALTELKTAEALRSDALQKGIRGAHHLFFTLNLDSCMASSAYFEEFLDRFQPILQQNVIFEVSEETVGTGVDRVKTSQAAHKLRLAVDDLELWQPKARKEISPLAEISKIGASTFRKLMDGIGEDPRRVIETIQQYMLSHKPLVVEGLEEHEDILFLEHYWPRDKWLPLYAQGYTIKPEQPWDAWLANLRYFGLPGGQILVSPFLAQATGLVREFLTDAEQEKIKRSWMGPVFRLELPGSAFGRKDPLVLGIVSDRVMPQTIPAAQLEGADYVIVHERGTSLQAEQITLDQLPSHLRALRNLPGVGRGALDQAPLSEQYSFSRWLPQDVKRPAPAENHLVRADVEEPARNGDIVIAARRFLFDWLTSPSAPLCTLLGDYGMGKTFLCRVFTNEVLEKRKADPNLPVPLYLDMRSLPPWKSGQLPGLEEMIKVLCNQAGFKDVSVEAVLAAVRLGHVALIFDGFDEQAAHLTDGEATALMNEIRRAVPPKAKGKMLVACRTHYFENRPHEREKVAGGALSRTREGRVSSDFRIVYIQPFDELRIRKYLERLFHDKAAQIFDFLNSIHDLMDLAHRPYLLFLITEHLSELEALAARGEPVGAAAVYQAVVEEWMRRDTGKHEIPTNVKVAFMEELARRLWADNRRQIHFEALRGWLQEQMKAKLSAVTLEDFGRADADLRTATFLVRDQDGLYRFAHTSFQEFFLARQIAAGLSTEQADVLTLPRLQREVLLFVIELLHGKRYRAASAAMTIQRALEDAYVPEMSENALLLALTWRKSWPDSAPEPSGFQLQGARLDGVALSCHDLENVDLSGADLRRADLTKARIRGRMRETNLYKVEAPEADLKGCDLRGAGLSGANLAGARLVNADLRGARGVSLFLQRADMTGARLDGAELSWARIAWARLSSEQARQASFHECSLPRVLPRPDRPLPKTFVPAVLSGHGGGVWSVRTSPDGRAIISGSSDKTVKIWEAGTGQCVRTLKGHAGWVLSVSCSPDGGAIVSGSSDKTARAWEAATGRCVYTLKGHDGEVLSVSYSPDGGTIVSGGSDKTVKVWETGSGRCVRTLRGHGGEVWSAACSPDGEIIASGSSDRTVRLWEAGSARCVRTLEGHEGVVRCVEFSPDGGTIASGGSDNVIKLWEADTGRCFRTLKGHTGWVWGVCFCPDGKTIISGSSDNTLKLWEADTGRCVRTLKGHTGWVWGVCFSPDGKTLISGSSDKTVKIWEPDTGRHMETLESHDGAVRSVEFSPDGRAVVSGSEDNSVKVYEATGRCLRRFKGHDGWVRCVGFSPNGRAIASSGDDNIVKVWETATGRCLRTLKGHEGWVRSVGFSPDGRSVVSGGDDRTVKIWTVATGRCLRTLEGHDGWVRCVGFSPDGKAIVSGGADRTLKVWKTSTGRCLRTLKGHGGEILCTGFSPDGKTVVSGGADKAVNIWNAVSGRHLHALKGHEGAVRGVRFSPDGGTIVTGSSDNTVKLWDAGTGRCVRTFKGHDGEVLSVAISPDGGTVVSGSSDKTLILWDAATGLRLVTLWGWHDDEWFVIAPDRTYDASPGGMRRLGFIHGQCVYPADEFHWLHKPGLLDSILSR